MEVIFKFGTPVDRRLTGLRDWPAQITERFVLYDHWTIRFSLNAECSCRIRKEARLEEGGGDTLCDLIAQQHTNRIRFE